MKKFFCLLLFAAVACLAQAQRYVGGDISLLSRYEEQGARYYDNGGKPCGDMLSFFLQAGHNAMRVRLFVDPSKAPKEEKGQGVCQDLDYVTRLARRIKEQGFALMLDFHYSDSWADPAKQYTPADWLPLGDDALCQRIYEYTRDCLAHLVEAGATPDFIQTGNEISYGMLWGERGTKSPKSYYAGKEANRTRFTSLLKHAGRACREVCPDAKIILHTERVANGNYSVAFYREMVADGVDFDIIGLSYYPYYHGPLSKLHTTLTQLENTQPGKQIMLVEVGYYHHWQPADVAYDYSSTWLISDAGQNAFARDLIEQLRKHEQSVTGLFWWSMESNECGLDWNTRRVTDSWYNAGLFDNQTGRACKALTTLADFLGPDHSAVSSPRQRPAQSKSYDLLGRPAVSARGICIAEGRKFLR